MNGFLAILLKEFAHIRRDRTTIFFAFLVPAIQMTIFGYAIDVTIENIPLVVLDLDGRQQSRQLIEAMHNSRTFQIAERTYDRDTFRSAIDSGRVKAGVIIPANYSEHLLRGKQAHVQVLIDGSDSQVATTAVNTVSLLAVNLSIVRAKSVAEQLQRFAARDEYGRPALPIDARSRLLYNPDLESSHFFVPGLVGIIMQLVLLFLTTFSIVKEREQGTLEQLFVTPVGKAGLMFGKLTPYALMAFLEMLFILGLMVGVFHVNITGSIWLLFGLSFIFIVTVLGMGLFISSIAQTQLSAIQLAFVIMLPSVLLSGFMFPRSEMPLPIYLISFVLPVTYFIEILRGIILRGAGLRDLIPHVLGLLACSTLILTAAVMRFRKQLD
jgi:ribosome-dependent ATPase